MQDISLKDIDTEIEKHRQEIAKHRLWISQLEDTRLNIMQLAEIRAAANGHGSPFGTFPNGATIMVREQKPAAVLAAPTKVKTRKKHDKAARSALREKVLTLLDGEVEGMTTEEMANHLGIGSTAKARNPLYQMLYMLRVTQHLISKDDAGRYRLAH